MNPVEDRLGSAAADDPGRYASTAAAKIASTRGFSALTNEVYSVYYEVYINDFEIMTNQNIGEFEQMVLLALLQCGEKPYAIAVRRVLEERASRSVSRGALYRTFDRLAGKGYLEWTLEDPTPVPERGGHPMRRFRLTEAGRNALRSSRRALLNLWDGIEAELET